MAAESVNQDWWGGYNHRADVGCATGSDINCNPWDYECHVDDEPNVLGQIPASITCHAAFKLHGSGSVTWTPGVSHSYDWDDDGIIDITACAVITWSTDLEGGSCGSVSTYGFTGYMFADECDGPQCGTYDLDVAPWDTLSGYADDYDSIRADDVVTVNYRNCDGEIVGGILFGWEQIGGSDVEHRKFVPVGATGDAGCTLYECDEDCCENPELCGEDQYCRGGSGEGACTCKPVGDGGEGDPGGGGGGEGEPDPDPTNCCDGGSCPEGQLCNGECACVGEDDGEPGETCCDGAACPGGTGCNGNCICSEMQGGCCDDASLCTGEQTCGEDCSCHDPESPVDCCEDPDACGEGQHCSGECGCVDDDPPPPTCCTGGTCASGTHCVTVAGVCSCQPDGDGDGDPPTGDCCENPSVCGEDFVCGEDCHCHDPVATCCEDPSLCSSTQHCTEDCACIENDCTETTCSAGQHWDAGMCSCVDNDDGPPDDGGGGTDGNTSATSYRSTCGNATWPEWCCGGNQFAWTSCAYHGLQTGMAAEGGPGNGPYIQCDFDIYQTRPDPSGVHSSVTGLTVHHFHCLPQELAQFGVEWYCFEQRQENCLEPLSVNWEVVNFIQNFQRNSNGGIGGGNLLEFEGKKILFLSSNDCGGSNENYCADWSSLAQAIRNASCSGSVSRGLVSGCGVLIYPSINRTDQTSGTGLVDDPTTGISDAISYLNSIGDTSSALQLAGLATGQLGDGISSITAHIGSGPVGDFTTNTGLWLESWKNAWDSTDVSDGGILKIPVPWPESWAPYDGHGGGGVTMGHIDLDLSSEIPGQPDSHFNGPWVGWVRYAIGTLVVMAVVIYIFGLIVPKSALPNQDTDGGH